MIPDSVKMGGTMRALDVQQFNDLRERVTKVFCNHSQLCRYHEHKRHRIRSCLKTTIKRTCS